MRARIAVVFESYDIIYQVRKKSISDYSCSYSCGGTSGSLWEKIPEAPVCSTATNKGR